MKTSGGEYSRVTPDECRELLQGQDKAAAVCAMAGRFWDRQAELSDVLYQSDVFKCAGRGPVKVIGTFYSHMSNGGIQRVISLLAELWHGQGYDVVLLTDSGPAPDDYLLPDYVARVKIGRGADQCTAENYSERGLSFAQLLEQYHVDCMVYHAYFSETLLFDTCICRALGIPFILYEHNVFSRFLRCHDRRFSTIPKFARLADAIVCLDDISRLWWRHFCGNTHKVLNPLTFDLNQIKPASRSGHNILFLCRLEEGAKRPSHAVDIAAMVIHRVPDAKMYIVGTGDKNEIKSLKKQINKLGMAGRIILCGFTMDVERYYLDSSVFLSCSAHEGAPMTLCEALSFGLPVVMYDLPYLEVLRDNHAMIRVPQEDKRAAADAICTLFADGTKRIELGNLGRKRLEELYAQDIGRQWEQVFASLYDRHPAADEMEFFLADVLVNDYLAGCGDREKEISLAGKIRRYYRQFGFWRTVRRLLEKVTGQG